MNSIPRFRATRRASARVPADENEDGMETPTTPSRPNASTAMAAVIAESMPPESPTTTRRKPFFRT